MGGSSNAPRLLKETTLLIFDLNTFSSDEVFGGYDVCIAGGGVAGITLAIQLADRGKRILLLEAGDREYTEESQKVYQGENVGRPYFELDEARLRFLGGTSNHWSGRCRPLDTHDFELRTHIPDSGWPISKAELDFYHERTCDILEISPEFRDQPVKDSAKMFESITFNHSPPVRFAEKYGDVLKTSQKIALFLNANLVNMRLNDNFDHVENVHCANYKINTKRFIFSSKAYVMAMGGIENPRMLLNFRDQIPIGIGNANDLVGRYFMEHFHLRGGYYTTAEEVWPFGQNQIVFGPTLAQLEKFGIANASLRVGPLFVPPSFYYRAKYRFVCSEEIVRDFISKFYDFSCAMPIYIGGYLKVVSEQAPNRDSRVTLTKKLDRFGLNRSELDWRITDIDRKTIKQIVTNFGVYLASLDIGNVKLKDWMLDDKLPLPGVGEDEIKGAGRHHMGTTRMADTPSSGVVDKNCRVFNTNNLFIAGSSVFSTSGHANPTFTIVQLALRLSDHLDSILNSSSI